jgi:hypothetical protein
MMTSDYIAPGEFSFCQRCGSPESCTFGGESITCDWCMPQDRKPCAQGTTEGTLRVLIDAAKRQRGRIAYECRERIAEIRMRAGMTPIWWMTAGAK